MTINDYQNELNTLNGILDSAEFYSDEWLAASKRIHEIAKIIASAPLPDIEIEVTEPETKAGDVYFKDGRSYVDDLDGHQWKVYEENGKLKVYIGRALEWETPTFLPIDIWRKAKEIIGTCSEQEDAKRVWGKAIHGF